MYKCTICGLEYNKKPDYCDCGNDSFEECTEKLQMREKFEDYKHEIPVKKILSAVIFILCIIFSIIVWGINPTPKTAENKTVQKTETTIQNIPDIDKIWNSTPPKNIEKAQNIITVYEKPLPKPAQEPQNNISQQKSEPQKVSKNTQTTKSKNLKKDIPKNLKNSNNTKTTAPQPQTQKPLQQTTKTQTPAQAVTKPTTQTVSKPEPPKEVQKNTNKDVKPAPVIQPPKPAKTMNTQEWANYKNSLRYALLSKLDIVKITGEGDCAVEFSFDKTGKLLNRKFVYKSANKTVNDQVYLMLMKLPVFKTPPANYNGEKVRIKFYINNGYYEISFMN